MYTLNVYNFAYHLYLHKTGATNTPKGDHHYVDYQGKTGHSRWPGWPVNWKSTHMETLTFLCTAWRRMKKNHSLYQLFFSLLAPQRERMSCSFWEVGDLVEKLANHAQSSFSLVSVGARGTAASGMGGPCHLVTLFECDIPPLAILKENTSFSLEKSVPLNILGGRVCLSKIGLFCFLAFRFWKWL